MGNKHFLHKIGISAWACVHGGVVKKIIVFSKRYSFEHVHDWHKVPAIVISGASLLFSLASLKELDMT